PTTPQRAAQQYGYKLPNPLPPTTPGSQPPAVSKSPASQPPKTSAPPASIQPKQGANLWARLEKSTKGSAEPGATNSAPSRPTEAAQVAGRSLGKAIPNEVRQIQVAVGPRPLTAEYRTQQ